MGINTPKIYIKVITPKSKKGKKIKRNIKMFRLNEQYATHSKELENIIKIKEIGTEYYIYDIMRLLPGAFKDKNEAYEFVFRNYFNDADFERQPLAKFTKDIVDEIGLLR